MAPHDRQARLSVRGICKRYAAPVLADVDLDIAPGEVHALVGANGAGKSTLARIISGLTAQDAGSLLLDGAQYSPTNKATAERHGVQIVQQELNLISTLTVGENLFLGCMPRRWGFVRYGQLHRQARQLLDNVGLHDVDSRTPVSRLGIGKQQLVEIAAAISRDCRVLILDEPTAALTDPQIDLLFEHIRQLRKEGVGLVYISHRLEEIRQIADRVTVLRDGRVVLTQSADLLPVDAMVRAMVGKDVEDAVRHREHDVGEPALRVHRFCRGDLVRDVSFELYRGEVLGVAGLIGSGRTELVRAIFGADQADSGNLYLGDSEQPLRFRHPRDAVRSGLAMIPEDRQRDGLLLPRSISLNSTLGSLPRVTRWGAWLSSARELAAAYQFSQALTVQRHSLRQSVRQLSGGNQQKVVIARWLMRDADVFLFDEPTRGIDVAAKATVYGLLNDLAARRKAILVVSSDLIELMAICDRMLVMSAGKLAATFARGEWTQEKILAAAISGYLVRSNQTQDETEK